MNDLSTPARKSVQKFDPNGPGIKGNLFGLPYTPHEAELVIIPIPWEVTVSYREGTAHAPQAILDASSQIDLCLKNIPDVWKFPVSMLPVPSDLLAESKKMRSLAANHIRAGESGREVIDTISVEKVNEACENLNIYVKSATQQLLSQGKSVALVGGDHSTPLGFLRALGDYHSSFGILHIDAHADLRKAYEGFTYSHGSIMYNALKIPEVIRIVQVGIRDYCQEELETMSRSMGRIRTFFDQDIKDQQFRGQTWGNITDSIVNELPDRVYISFDIDGLDPTLCPGTGTPVPGGLQFDEAVYLIQKVVSSGRKIIGFDLNEVAPSTEWDATVGARVLFQLCVAMGISMNRLSVER